MTNPEMNPHLLGALGALAALPLAVSAHAERIVGTTPWLRAIQIPLVTGPLVERPSFKDLLADLESEARVSSDRAVNARLTIKDGALSTRSLWIMAQASQSAPGNVSKQGLLEVAQDVSRRDPLVQLSKLQSSAAEGNGTASLRHLDRLLSANPAIGMKTFPYLDANLQDGEFRRLLAARQDRPWYSTFLGDMIANGTDLTGLLLLVRDNVVTASQVLQTRQKTALLDRVVREQRLEDVAWVATQMLGKPKEVLTRLSIDEASLDPELGILSWRPASDEVVITPSQDGRAAVEFEASGVKPLLRRTTVLPSGMYSAEGFLSDEAGVSKPAVYLTMTCRFSDASGRPPFRSEMTLRDSRGTAKPSIDVPEGCITQEWVLSVNSDSGQNSVTVGT